MLCEVVRLIAGALLEHLKLGPRPLRDPGVHLSRPTAPFDWFAHACTAGAPKFSDALAPHSLTLTEPALPLTSSFPSTSGSQSLHASPSSSNRAKQHAARRILLFLAGIATLSSSSPLSTRSPCLLSAFPVPARFQLRVRGIPLKPQGRVSCASPTRCIPPRGPVSPIRKLLFELANTALRTLEPSRHSHRV